MRFRALALLGAVIALAGSLSGCLTTQQTQNIVTVACAVDTLVPGAVATAGTIAVIADPSTAAAVSKVNAIDQATHPAVQKACDMALPASKPIPGTVATTSVPIAPATLAVPAINIPIAAPIPAAQ